MISECSADSLGWRTEAEASPHRVIARLDSSSLRAKRGNPCCEPKAMQSHSRMKRKQPPMPKKLETDQKGFTLIEIVIAVAIAGLVVAAAAGAVVQLVQSADTTAHMLAVRQVQQAGYWLSTDALQAQNVTDTPPTGAPGFPLHLSWTDYEGSGHNVTYAREATDDLYNLMRSDGATNITVARYLTESTTCSWNATAGLLTFTVEASVMGARGPETEMRTYEVKPRPSL